MKTEFHRVIQALVSLTAASENLQTREHTNHFAFNRKFLLHVTLVLGKINLIQKKLQECVIDLGWSVTHIDASKIFFKTGTVWCLNQLINVKQSAKKWKFRLKSGLEKKKATWAKER